MDLDKFYQSTPVIIAPSPSPNNQAREKKLADRSDTFACFQPELLFNCYLATPQSTLGHSWGSSLIRSLRWMIIQPKGNRESRNDF